MASLEHQALEDLVSYYRGKGLGFKSVIVDPVFRTLPLKVKLDAIKRYAPDISSELNGGLWQHNKKDIIAGSFGGVVTGAVAGFSAIPLGMAILKKVGVPIANVAARNKAIALGMASTVVMGGILGAIASTAEATIDQKHRQEYQHHLNAVSKDPSGKNTIGALSFSERGPRSLYGTLLRKITGKIEPISSKAFSENTPRLYAHSYGALTGMMNDHPLFKE